MGEKTITTYTCDCCGRESEKSDFNDGRECGRAKFSLHSTHGAMAYDGAWGGGSSHIEDLLCFKCSRKLQDFYKKLKKEFQGEK